MLDYVFLESIGSLTYLHCSQDKLDRIVRYWRVVGFEVQIQRNLGADKPVFGTRVWRFTEECFPAGYRQYTNHQDNVQYFADINSYKKHNFTYKVVMSLLIFLIYKTLLSSHNKPCRNDSRHEIDSKLMRHLTYVHVWPSF